MTQTKTTDYEITDYGIDHAQYFQGHGTSYTSYDSCCLGVGDTYAEALADALDCTAMAGTHIDLLPDDEPAQWEGKGPSVSAMIEAQRKTDKDDHEGEDHEEKDYDDCELYYYVGLRWN